jgi:hypothetical protein
LTDRDKLDIPTRAEDEEAADIDSEPEEPEEHKPEDGSVEGEEDWADFDEEDNFGYSRHLSDDENSEPDEDDEGDMNLEDVQLGAEDGEDDEEDTGFADL